MLALVGERLEWGDDPLALLEACQEGMRQVGLHYDQHEYYLSGLMMAGEILRELMELVEPALVERLQGSELARTPCIIGGGLLNAQVCAYVGADYWAIDAMVGVGLCKQIVAARERTA